MQHFSFVKRLKPYSACARALVKMLNSKPFSFDFVMTVVKKFFQMPMSISKPTDKHREITQLRCSRMDIYDAKRRGYNPRTNQLCCALYPALGLCRVQPHTHRETISPLCLCECVYKQQNEHDCITMPYTKCTYQYTSAHTYVFIFVWTPFSNCELFISA